MMIPVIDIYEMIMMMMLMRNSMVGEFGGGRRDNLDLVKNMST